MSTIDLQEVARWLAEDTGFPFDWSSGDKLPPEPLRRAVEDWWVEHDGDGTDEEAEAIRQTCAEEGGWFEYVVRFEGRDDDA
jgi:hypothetical protein